MNRAGDPRPRPRPGRSLRVTVPASTANLGSGFDTLGMALSLYDTVDIEVLEGPAEATEVTVEGESAGSVRTDERHLVVRVLHETLMDLGYEAPALRLHCHNTIPHSRGLGSSAAAIIAGVTAAYVLAGFSSREYETDVLRRAASYEGHADNAAASLLGGAVIAWSEQGRFHATKLTPHPAVRPFVLVPATESATHTTRGLLPAKVPHEDAAFAASRAALAVHALTSDPDLLLAATEDRLHQRYRETAWPETVSLISRLRRSGVPAAVSGAGPTVLALPSTRELPGEIDLGAFDAMPLTVEYTGVRVVEN